MGRELCLFLKLDAGKVAQRQRRDYVALAVRRAAPFPDPEFDVLWLGDTAAVWYWSRQRVLGLPGHPTGKVRHRAEAMYRGAVRLDDGCELLEYPGVTTPDVPSGFEVRIWRDGALASSRWWASQPSPTHWQTVVRGAGLSPLTPLPSSTLAPLREMPLDALRGRHASALTGQLAGQGRLAAAVLAGVVVAALLWQAAGVARAAWEVRSVERRTAVITKRLEDVVRARERADAALARVDAALALRPPASQTRLLGEVATVTPGEWRLLTWNQSNPEVLEVTLKMDNPDPSAVVAAWEASPLLQEVTPASGGRPGELTLQARVTAPGGGTP